MPKLSLALATFNEESNIERCLNSIKDLVDEIVIVDGSSVDQTVEIAKKFDAKILVTNNPPIFHINKQKAVDKATGEWILQLDADEEVSKPLANEVKKIIEMSDEEIEKYQQALPDKRLFLRHQQLIEERDGKVGEDSLPYAAFFIPRFNYFLGKFLKYGGLYPDGVIRLFKKGKAYLPAKDVHEQYVVKGKVGWLKHPLYHYDSPTFSRYIQRNNRYINLLADDFKKHHLKKNLPLFLNYFLVKPVWWFLLTQFRHKGILDGYQGLIFSFFSALRFPRAYYRYLINNK